MKEAELETWMDSKGVSESERLQFREFAKHSESCYTENWQYLKHPLDKEDLLSVLLRMERYLVDSTWIERFWRDYHGESSRNRPVNTGESVL
jgi:hypothetical protein